MAVVIAIGLSHAAVATAKTTALAAAPGWITDRYTVDDGLPTNLVTAVAQAGDGAIWAATFDGLVRLDGSDIHAVRRSEVPDFPGNRFISLVADGGGALWALEEHGALVWLSPAAGDRWRSVPTAGRGCFLQIISGTAWLASTTGLERLQAGRATRWHAQVIASEVLALAEGDLGSLWVAGAARELWRVPAEGVPQAFGRAPGTSGAPITALAADSEGGVWAGTDGGGLMRSRGGVLHQRVEANWTSGARPIRELLPGDRGSLQARSDEAWWSLGPNGWLPEPAMAMPAMPAHMHCRSPSAGRQRWRVGPQGLYLDRALVAPLSSGVRQIYLDRQANLWVATERAGLLCVRPAAVKALELGPAGDQVVAAVTWVGQQNLWVVNHTGQLLHSPDLGRTWAAEAPRVVSAALPGQLMVDAHVEWPDWTHSGLSATSVYAAANGAVWVGTDSGVALWSEAGLLAAEFPWRGGDKTLVLSMFADSQGRFWAATPHGLAVADAAGLRAAAGLAGSKRAAWRWHGGPGGRAIGGAHTFAQGADGDLWLTTGQQGIARIRGAATELVTSAQGLPDSRLRGLWIADPATLWVGTLDAGLCRVRLRPGQPLAHARIGCLTRAHGLRDDAVHSLAADDQGRLWLSGNRGITALQLRNAHAVLDGESADLLPLLLGRQHGMADAETNGYRSPALAVGPRGQLLWPTQHGLALVDPREFPTPQPPAVALTAVEAHGNLLPWSGGGVTLQPGADVTIRWNAPEFRWADQLRFRYRLGSAAPWQIARDQRWARWNGLAPGRHVFELQAGLDGNWSKAATLTVDRPPAFRESWAFTALVVAASLLLAGLAVAGWFRQQRRLRRRLEAAVAARTAELSDSNRELTTQRSELAQQARQLREQSHLLVDLDQQKSAVLSNVSHELRTPLMLLQAPIAQLQAAARPADLATFGVIQRSVADLSRLVDQLLKAASLQVGGVQLTAVEQDLTTLLLRLADQFAPTATAAGLALTVAGQPGPLLLTFDADLLAMALSNLLVNAVKFTPAGGSVAVRWRVDEVARTVCITVADSGPGIDPAEHQRIFDRFYQVHRGDARPHGGVGIGLSLAKEIAELHGGRIGVHSALGSGSEFWVELPGPARIGAPSQPPPASIEPPAQAPRSAQPGARKRILIVEDHLEMLAFLAASLDDHFDVATASDGRAALKRIAEQRPDAIVSDVMMAGVDGLALCAQLRADPNLRELPVILISAKGTPRDLTAGLSVAQDYLVKPFAMAELLQRIWLLVEPSRMRDNPTPTPDKPTPDHEIVPNVADRAFIARLSAVMDARLDDPYLTMADLAKSMDMSARTLQRELARTTGQRPVDLLNAVRLQRARQWMETGQFRTLTEVARAVGISPRHLRRLLHGAAGQGEVTEEP